MVMVHFVMEIKKIIVVKEVKLKVVAKNKALFNIIN